MNRTIVDSLSRAIAGAVIDLDEEQRRIAVALYELLADGDPVTTDELAERSGAALTTVGARLSAWPGVFRDGDGRVIGFWGLALPEMAHRFQAEGGKPLYSWCALDPLLIVPVINRSAKVESKDPVTGSAITMTVTPEGIHDLVPASAVMSFVQPDGPFDQSVIETFCNYVHNFASLESGQRWASTHEGIVLLPTLEAFEVGLRAWAGFRVRPGTSAIDPQLVVP